MTRQLKIKSYRFTRKDPDTSHSFFLEVEGKNKLLCYEECGYVIARMPISKKSFQSLLKYQDGVARTNWWENEDTYERLKRETSQMMDDVFNGRKDKIPRELNPFIVQVFDPNI